MTITLMVLLVEVVGVSFSFSTGDFSVGQLLLQLGVPGGAAVATYVFIYRYYRNTDKSHQYEKETTVEVFNVLRYDQKTGVTLGSKSKWIAGRNSHIPRTRVERLKLHIR